MERLEYLLEEARDIQKGREQDSFIDFFYPACERKKKREG